MKIRHSTIEDVADMCEIINEIISIGGTTAYEKHLTTNEVSSIFMSSANCICCFVAVENGLVLGFQALSTWSELDVGWADIATFSRANPKTPGVGTALFVATSEFARENGIRNINATIRSDNMSGLKYYEIMGFENYSVQKKVPLQDGTPIDRISKCLEI